MVGIYPNYQSAYAAWKGAAQRSVDNAMMRYFIVHLHRLLAPNGLAAGDTHIVTSLPQKAEKKQRPRLRLDAASRALFPRFMMDWVWPRRLELIWTLFLTVCLAGVTGSYPAIIKKSFDLLMGGHKGALPWVLAAIVGITLARATLLFLQAVASSRVVLRLTSDMQKVAFRHLINSDFSRLSRETPGRLMSRLTNDIGFIQVALTAGLNSFLRDLFSVIALVFAMLYLDWAMTLIVLGVYPLAAIPVAAISDGSAALQNARRAALAT